MTHNDVLRSLRYLLDLADGHIVAIVHLVDAAFPIDAADVHALLKTPTEPGFVVCSDRVLAHVLDGLVIRMRGRDEDVPLRPVATRVTNNLVLKKLRVAFQLKDVDMHRIFASSGFPIGKPELSALFRQPGHKHYRACGDQILRNFLKGLTSQVRGGATQPQASAAAGA